MDIGTDLLMGFRKYLLKELESSRYVLETEKTTVVSYAFFDNQKKRVNDALNDVREIEKNILQVNELLHKRKITPPEVEDEYDRLHENTD